MIDFVNSKNGRPPGSSGVHFFLRRRILSGAVAITVVLILQTCSLAIAQSSAKTKQKKPKTEKTEKSQQSDLSKLRSEFIEATREYKSKLEKLQASYENDVKKAEEKLLVSQKLYSDGLIAKVKLEESEHLLALAKEKVTETTRQIASADSQVAAVFLEERADEQLAKSIARGALLRTTALIRYNGSSSFTLSESGRIQSFFFDLFKRPLPVAVFGQGAIHDRWRLDHRNAMDISLHPDSVEGQALLGFLQKNGIPFLAFREAIPGTATGPHIHIGKPSHRY